MLTGLLVLGGLRLAATLATCTARRGWLEPHRESVVGMQFGDLCVSGVSLSLTDVGSSTQ
jgi:hypothetical protein